MLKNILKRISAIALAGTMLAGMITVPASAAPVFYEELWASDFSVDVAKKQVNSSAGKAVGAVADAADYAWGGAIYTEVANNAIKWYTNNNGGAKQIRIFTGDTGLSTTANTIVEFDMLIDNLTDGTTVSSASAKTLDTRFKFNLDGPARQNVPTDYIFSLYQIFSAEADYDENANPITVKPIKGDTISIMPTVKNHFKMVLDPINDEITLTVTDESDTVLGTSTIATTSDFTSLSNMALSSGYAKGCDIEISEITITKHMPITDPTALVAEDNYSGSTASVNLSWTASDIENGADSVTYNVLRKEKNSDAAPTVIASGVSTNAYSDDIDASEYNKEYTYYVEAVNSTGYTSGRCSASTKVQMEKPKSLAAAYNHTSGKVELSWTAPADAETGVDYEIWRKETLHTGAETGPSLLTTVTDVTSYDDSDSLAENAVYEYYLIAKVGAYASEQSAVASDTTALVGKTTGLTVTQIDSGEQIKLEWDSVLNATSYQITRNGELLTVDEASEPTTTVFVDNDVEYSKVYTYVVTTRRNDETGNTLSVFPSDAVTKIVLNPIYDGVFVPISGAATDMSTSAPAVEDTDNKIDGEASYRVDFSTANTGLLVDSTAYDYYDGGLITLCVDANGKSPDGIYLQLADAALSAEVKLSNYAPSTIDGWTYIAVPIADLIAANGAVDFEKIQSIAVYAKENLEANKTFNIDKIAYTNYTRPDVKLCLEDGTEVTGAIESSSVVNKLLVKFESPIEGVAEIDENTVTNTTVKLMQGASPVTAEAYATEDGIEIFVPNNLQSAISDYKVVLDGVKTWTGAAVAVGLPFTTGAVGKAVQTADTIWNNPDLVDIVYHNSYYNESLIYPNTGCGVSCIGVGTLESASAAGKPAELTYGSDDKVRSGMYNDSGKAVPTGDYAFFGAQHYNYTAWSRAIYSIANYADTAVVSVDVYIGNENFRQNAHIFLRDTAGDTVISINELYPTAGVWQRITIPVKDFVEEGFDPVNFIGAGLAFGNTETLTDANVQVKLDNLWIANVSAPREVEVVGTGRNSATIGWKSSQSQVEKYQIMRTDGVTTVKVAEVSATATQYTDNTIPGVGTYEYFVYGVNAIGARSIASNSATAEITALGAPLNFDVKTSFGTELKADLSWQAPDALGSYTYNVYRATGAGTFDILTENYAGLAYSDTDVSNNSEYTYYVTTFDGVGESSASIKKTVTVGYMGVPENLTATDAASGIDLAWEPVDNAQKYNIYRNGELLTDETTSAYQDTTVVVGETYEYTVTAVYGDNESAQSNTAYAVHYGTVISGSEKLIYKDFAEDGYVAKSVGGATVELDDEVVARDSFSYKIKFAGGVDTFNGITFAKGTTVYLSDHYANGGMFSMFVKTNSANALKDVKLGLSCTKKINNKNVEIRTYVELSDYVAGRYGEWVFIQVPMSDFPATGEYMATQLQPAKADFDFSLVDDISIYIDKVSAMLEKVVYIDQLSYTKYVAPAIDTVEYEDSSVDPATNNAIANGGTIASGTVDKLLVTFDSAMKADSFTADTVTLTEGADTKVSVVPEYSNGVLTVAIPGGLKASKTYKLSLRGVKSATGGVMSGAAADYTFSTGTITEIPQQPLPTTAAFTVTAPATVLNGGLVNAKVTLSGTAKAATIESGVITVKYTKTILSVVEKNITLSSALKTAGATIDTTTTGVIKVTIPAGAVILGTDIMTISFNTEATGRAAVEAGATLTDTAANTLTFTNAAANVTVGANSPTNNLPPANNGNNSSSLPFGPTRDTSTEYGGIIVTDQNGNTQTEGNAIFGDVTSHWAKDYIEFLYENGYVSGYDDGTFGPDNSITREEFLKMLLGAAKVDTTGAETTFGDVAANDWFYGVVAAAERDGVVNGDDSGNFGKGRRITREDMCTMVVRAADIYYINFQSTYLANMFDDYSQISDYAKDSVMRLQTAGVIDGVGDNKFAPKGDVTRAMAAKIIYEVVQKIANG